MKKMVLGLIFATVAFSQEYTKQNRIDDMQTMASAMAKIESGFLYNNKDLVEAGVIKLSDAIRRVEAPLEEKEEKNPMTRYMNQKVQFTNKITKKIDKKARLILERFNNNDISQAVQAYTKIIKECVNCHTQIRHW
jgi:cytochrome c556